MPGNDFTLMYELIISSTKMDNFLIPFTYAFALYAIRYFVLAGLSFAYSKSKHFVGSSRPHIVPPPEFSYTPHIQRELLNSLVTIIVFASVTGFLIGFDLIQHTQIYKDFNQYPVWWFVLSIILALLLFDTFFYWAHRLLHTKLFYPLHKLHHLSVYPSPFTSYSFFFGESLLDALIVVAIIFVLPMHPLAIFIYQTLSVANIVYGHSSREIMPAAILNSWFGQFLNTASLHAYHHYTEQTNYSAFFNIWDKWMGTLHPVSNQSDAID